MLIQHGHAKIVRDSDQWRAEVDLGDDHPSAVGPDPITAAMFLLNKLGAKARADRSAW